LESADLLVYYEVASFGLRMTTWLATATASPRLDQGMNTWAATGPGYADGGGASFGNWW